MTAINNLSTIDALAGGDQVPVYDSDAGTARKASLSQFVTYFKSAFASPEFTTIINAPTSSGFNLQMVAATTNVWMIINPTGAFAAGTITLPPVADCFDGQQIVVTCSNYLLALTVTGNGATVLGEPESLTANGFFALRFNALQSTWYCTAGAYAFSDIEIANQIVDGSGNVILYLGSPDTLAVNHLSLSNANAGSNVELLARGASTDIGIDINAKGGGGLALTGDSFLASVSFATITGTLDAGVTTVPSLTTTATTVGALGSAATKGQRKFVTDSNAAMTAGIGAVVAAGGANNVPVYADGTNWRIG
jgi:hypothetical protein